MIQYILTESSRYSVAELAQMVIEGGCGWIDLHMPDLSDDELRRLLVPDVVELCRESGVFLTIDDRPELARELGLHGVRFTCGSLPANIPQSPAGLRDMMGPEAVIGIETADPSAIPDMVSADIDYVCTPASFDEDDRRRFIEAVRSSGVSIPIVAQGDITAENAVRILSEGFSGLAVGRFVTMASDPVQAMESLIKASAR